MPETQEIVHALFCDFFERGVRYFFPDADLRATGSAAETNPSLTFHNRTDGGLELEWMGTCYDCHRNGRSFTEDQLRLLGSIGAVLSARYRSIFHAVSAATPRLFTGLAEDRFVSAFLDHTPYLDESGLPAERNVVSDAIEVLRESSLITYENRRISTGVILVGAGEDPYNRVREMPRDALPYDTSLVAIKSFHRLCDGLNTVFLVNREGMLVDLVDIEQFCACGAAQLPVPSPTRYRAHCLATLFGGHICLALTPNGEIKVFAGGVQVFHFMEGHWHLTDIREKYHEFRKAVGDRKLAERLFAVAMNLAENRRGGLFVLLDQPESVGELVAPQDRIENCLEEASNKAQVHYLLRKKHVLELETSVLQSIARVDGGIVMDRVGRLLAFGAILRNSGAAWAAAQDGGRTTAAVHSSRFGLAIKISEDGMVSFYRNGVQVWEI
jgi:hypothetical protein